MNLHGIPICPGCDRVKIYCDCGTHWGEARKAGKKFNRMMETFGFHAAGQSEVMPRQHNNRTILRNES